MTVRDMNFTASQLAAPSSHAAIPQTKSESSIAFDGLHDSVNSLENIVGEFVKRLEAGGVLHLTPGQPVGDKAENPFSAPLSQSLHAKATQVCRVVCTIRETIDRLAI